MNRRPFAVTVLAGLALTLVAAPVLRAQIGTPPKITAPIHAAKRVTAATNAHIEAEQHPENPAPAAQRPAPQPRVIASATAGRDSSARRDAASRTVAAPGRAESRVPSPASRAQTFTPAPERADSVNPVLTRETFHYSADDRRDPFVSLMTSGELRPMISDLKLVAIIYDPAGHSVAVLRDLSTNEQYRVTVGKTLGRMRVAQIQPKSVTFTLDEFGYSQQEVLALNDSTTERAQ